jgi:hypothetical protein
MTKQLIDISAIESLVATIHEEGKDVVMSEDANRQIAQFKKAQKLMAEAEKILKVHIREALEPFNAKSIKGQWATISLTKARQPSAPYTVDYKKKDDPELKPFMKEKITLVPDELKIDEFKEEHGYLPPHITIAEAGEPGLSIRLKDYAE